MSKDVGEGGPFFGALLRVVWQRIREQIHSGVVKAGFDDLHPAHIEMFRYPSPDGMRPSELAAQLQLSKQTVNDLVGHMESCGYLLRQPDPHDGRARVLRLTAKGRRVEATVHAHALLAEEGIAATLGARRFGELRRALSQLAAPDLDPRDPSR